MRALGIDFGDKRIGLAISDPGGRMAVPLLTLERRNDRAAARQIAAIAAREAVGRLVLGEPLGPDGRRTEWTARVERFGARLRATSGLPVEMVTESLTSVEATALLVEAGVDVRREKGKIDAVAAQILLQESLDRAGRRPPPEPARDPG